ncbi:MAG: hypothetical protein L0H23_10190 [Luteimonas sp.]|nr:hypothetical protein [Luteimonas sp.]
MPGPAIAPLLATAGFGWLYYRRIRRQFGRQPYRPKRTMLRIGVLSLLACALLVSGLLAQRLWPALAIGSVAGGALGWLALRHTRVAIVDGVREYVPNPWLGGLIALLLVARLAWRWYRFEDMGAGAGMQAAGMQASPLTYGLLVALVAYYLVNSIGLVRRMRALPPG